MSLIHLDHDTLDDAVTTNDMMVVDFWASWCGPCLRFAPVFEAVAGQTQNVTFAKFQVDATPANQNKFVELGFQAVPTLLFFKQGHLLSVIPGALDKKSFSDVVGQLQAFDVSTLKETAPAA